MDQDKKQQSETVSGDTWLYGCRKHLSKPQVFRNVVPTLKQVKENGEVRVVPSNDRDFDKETQSHRNEVGIENIFQQMPDGSYRVNPAASSVQAPMYGDFTKVPRFRSGAVPVVNAGHEIISSLEKAFPGKDWSKMSMDQIKENLNGEISKMRSIAEIIGSQKKGDDSK